VRHPWEGVVMFSQFIARILRSTDPRPITTGYQPVLPESGLMISMPPVKPPRGASSAHKAALLDMHERYAEVKRDHAEAFWRSQSMRKPHEDTYALNDPPSGGSSVRPSDLSVTFQTMKNVAWLNRAMHEAMLELLAK
jgi:hypothetical protein